MPAEYETLLRAGPRKGGQGGIRAAVGAARLFGGFGKRKALRVEGSVVYANKLTRAQKKEAKEKGFKTIRVPVGKDGRVAQKYRDASKQTLGSRATTAVRGFTSRFRRR